MLRDLAVLEMLEYKSEDPILDTHIRGSKQIDTI